MKYLITIGLLMASIFNYAQTSYDPRLNSKYTDEYIQNLPVENINSLEFSLDNIYFIDDNFEKNESLPELFIINNSTKQVIEESLINVDFNNFNILNYNFEQKYSSRNYYRIGNTGKTLVIYSGKEYAEMYNSFKQSN